MHLLCQHVQACGTGHLGRLLGSGGGGFRPELHLQAAGSCQSVWAGHLHPAVVGLGTLLGLGTGHLQAAGVGAEHLQAAGVGLGTLLGGWGWAF